MLFFACSKSFRCVPPYVAKACAGRLVLTRMVGERSRLVYPAVSTQGDTQCRGSSTKGEVARCRGALLPIASCQIQERGTCQGSSHTKNATATQTIVNYYAAAPKYDYAGKPSFRGRMPGKARKMAFARGSSG